jgi:hypothetical protein
VARCWGRGWGGRERGELRGEQGRGSVLGSGTGDRRQRDGREREREENSRVGGAVTAMELMKG